MELRGKRILILVADLYQELEFWYPYYRMKEAGAAVKVAGLAAEHKSKLGYPVKPDGAIEHFDAKEFDAVIIPGGYAPDIMRRSKPLVEFVRQMHQQGKVVAAICHAAWVPISARIVKGKKMTCFESIRDDLINAGAEYVNEPVVVDGNLISSRIPDDLPFFCQAIIHALH